MSGFKDQIGDRPYIPPTPRPAYPATAGYREGVDTSKAASESLDSHVDGLRRRVLEYIARRVDGATYDEVVVDLALTPQSVSGRIRELVLLGKIEDSGERRKTRSLRNARVYRAVRR
jgi:hypothetical protein